MDVSTLRALRIKTGLSQARMSQLLMLNRRTISRWETSGDISEKNLANLVDLAERVSAPMPALPRGRPGKTWTRFSNGRHWNGWKHVRTADVYPGKPRPIYWLWRPGHREHGYSIIAPPTGLGDSWTEKTEVDDVRIRYAIDENGTEYQAEIIEGYIARLKETES